MNKNLNTPKKDKKEPVIAKDNNGMEFIPIEKDIELITKNKIELELVDTAEDDIINRRFL